jgi:hypothetical protein
LTAGVTESSRTTERGSRLTRPTGKGVPRRPTAFETQETAGPAATVAVALEAGSAALAARVEFVVSESLAFADVRIPLS